MNQTKKRLSIIKTAISITDIETIQLQVLKLGMLKTDEKIQTIISMLQAENYAQAQGLITTYIERTDTENILQRSSQEKKHILSEEEQSTIDEFQLFVTADENEKREIDMNDFLTDDLQLPTNNSLKKEEVQEIDLNDFLNVTPLNSPTPSNTNKFDSLLEIEAEDVLTDNIDLNINYSEEDSFFSLPTQKKETTILHTDIPKDTFFDTHDTVSTEDKSEPEKEKESIDTSTPILNQEEVHTDIDNDTLEEVKFSPEETSSETVIDETNLPTYYKAIPYIVQKLENMYKQYPSSYTNSETSSSFSELLTKISQEPYGEDLIEETLQNIKQLKEKELFSEAMQLLLLSAATPSPFAQLILARELYTGTLLTKNIPQAFTILNTLAMDDYPEALCDLGQFHENGIGTKADKKRATELYKNAMDLGIRRAKKHFKRMQKKKKGFFRK